MTEYPSFLQQGQNLINSIKQIATSNQPLTVSDEIKEQRMTICRACDEYDADQVRCRKCGCFLLIKTSFSVDSCPLQKWSSTLTKLKQEESINLNKPTFPKSPTINQTYTWNDITWIWNGKMWDLNITHNQEES